MTTQNVNRMGCLEISLRISRFHAIPFTLKESLETSRKSLFSGFR